MTRQVETREIDMELSEIPGTSLKVSRVAIGTWAIGGWMWGGTDEAESVSTIRAALEHGINLIDTAPVYGFGRSEEIVGKAIAEGGGPEKTLLALGYAGWAPGQLDGEIQANGWLHAPADFGIVFDDELDTKWTRAISKIGIDLALLSGEAGHA